MSKKRRDTKLSKKSSVDSEAPRESEEAQAPAEEYPRLAGAAEVYNFEPVKVRFED